MAFKEGLSELGWVEGKTSSSSIVTAEGHGEKYSDFAAELVRLNVDVIVAGSGNGRRKEQAPFPLLWRK